MWWPSCWTDVIYALSIAPHDPTLIQGVLQALFSAMLLLKESSLIQDYMSDSYSNDIFSLLYHVKEICQDSSDRSVNISNVMLYTIIMQ